MAVGTTITNAAYKLFKRFTRSADKAVEDPDGPNQDAADTADRELKEGAAESGKSYSDEAGKQARKRVSNWGELHPAERWCIDRINELFNLAEKWRKGITKSWKPVKVALAVGAAATIASLAAELPGPAPQPAPPPPDTVVVNGDDIPPPPPDNLPPPDTLTMDEFDALASRLNFSPYSLAALGRERVDLDVSDISTVTMPPLVAAWADAPVEVSTHRGNETYSDTTTVQELYEAMPESHDQIEEAVRENGGSGIHVDIDVRTEFANISIRG